MAGEDITILFPEHDVTYGPWSDTYVPYPRTGGNAHVTSPQLEVNEETVAYYVLYLNDLAIINQGNIPTDELTEVGFDFNPEDNVWDWEPNDKEPVDMYAPYSALNTLTAVAYDQNRNEIDRDEVTFFYAVNIEDYFEVLERHESGEIGFTIRPEDIEKINVEKEIVEDSTLLFEVTKEYTYLTVKNKFSGKEEEHTAIKLTITPKTPGVDLTLYSLIPKHIAEHVNELVLEDDFTVIDPDPVMMWQFANVQEAKTLEYHVEKKLKAEEIEEIRAITVSDMAAKQKPLWYFLIPILLIPMIMFSFIYFSRYQQHHKG